MTQTQDPREAMAAWQADPGNRALFWALLESLGQYGSFSTVISALNLYQKYGKIDCQILCFVGQQALITGQPELAARFFKQGLAQDPLSPTPYTGLIRVYYHESQADAAIAVFKRAMANGVVHFSILNEIGYVYRTLLNDRQTAKKYFEYAWQLNSDDAATLDNIASTRARKEDPEVVIALYEKALKDRPEDPQLRINFATFLFGRGYVDRAWPHYRYRTDPKAGPRLGVRYNPALPRWDGDDLAGKRVMVMAEQGLGDEVMFGFMLPALAQEAAGLAIGCDGRLVDAFQRAFPQAHVGAYQDVVVNQVRDRVFPALEKPFLDGDLNLDHALPIGCLGERYWRDPKALPPWPRGYLSADPALSHRMAERAGPRTGLPRIGVAWRSGYVNVERAAAYMMPEDIVHLFQDVEAEVHLLQYGSEPWEMDAIKDGLSGPVHRYDDIDLKNDLEANLAIMEQLDLIIAPPTATLMLSLALGKPTWLINGGPPWWFMGDRRERPAHIPHLRWLWRKVPGKPQEERMAEPVAALRAFIAAGGDEAAALP